MVVLLTALYVVLRPVGRGLALFATFSRLAYAFLWFVMILDLFAVLRLMGGFSYLQALESDRLRALAGLRLASGLDAYYIGLMFYGLGSVVFSYLWFKSRYIPRTLAAGVSCPRCLQGSARLLTSFFPASEKSFR
jgi:hypothetical protein